MSCPQQRHASSQLRRGRQDGSATHIARSKVALIVSCSKPFRLDSHERYVTTSIGISIFPADGREEKTLIKAADAAMYRANQTGRNTFHFYAGETSAGAPN